MNTEVIKEFEKNSESVFGKNLHNYYNFLSWARWFPDLFLDLIKPETGGLNLHLDQRIFLRCDLRFMNMYGTFSRGYAKTFNEVLAMIIVALLYPNIELALSAQTKENAADLLKQKWNFCKYSFSLLYFVTRKKVWKDI